MVPSQNTEPFERWLRDQGHREEGILTYTRAIKLFLKIVKNANPSIQDARYYHSTMVESNLARSTVNIRAAALKAFYKYQGTILDLPYLKINNKIPYFFSEEEVGAIFNTITNIKHYAMLSLMYHCLLRVSDLCNLEDDDLDLKNMTLRIRDGKFGKPALLPIPHPCAQVLKEYLQIRPRIEINGKYPLFYSERLNKFNRRSVETVFHACKKRAGVTKPGGCHVFGRHSPASIMVKNGCDIFSLQMLMRHSSITTTSRYLHTDVATLREKQNKYLDI
jgi:integrase/recombinase XerD